MGIDPVFLFLCCLRKRLKILNECDILAFQNVLILERPFETGGVVWIRMNMSVWHPFIWIVPIKYRQIVHLYYFEDYSTKEIAQIMKLTETAVQTRLLRARQKLKEKLKEDGNE